MSKRVLHVSDSFTLPVDWIMKATVGYGARGTGKTTFGAVVAEEVTKAGQRFCAIDLKGDFYGLRSSADGRSAGIPVVIFGGDHADLPLEPDAGNFLGELVAGLEQSVVLDLEHLSKGKQVKFLGEFFAALYHKNREPLLVIADEAQRYAPQSPISPEAHVCLGAVEDLVKLGRKHGLGVLLLTQRGSGLNKEVSEICDMLVAFRSPGKLDQDRIRGWLQVNGFEWPTVEVDDEGAKKTVPLVARLKKGQALAASADPDLKVGSRTVQMRNRETFDSSATPEIGQRRREPKMLAKPELDAIKAQMSETIERAKADDPKVLRKRIVELEREVKLTSADKRVAELEERLSNVMRERPTERVSVPVVKAEQIARVERLAEKLKNASIDLDKHAGALVEALGKAKPVEAPVAAVFARKALPPARPVAVVVKRTTRPTDSTVSGAQQRILDALAWYEAVGIVESSRAAVAAVAGMKQAGYFNNSLGALRTADRVSYPKGAHVALTDAGRAVANAPDSMPTLAALHASIFSTVNKFQGEILRVLCDAYPDDMSRATLAEQVGKTESGYFNNTLGSLRTMELVDYPSGGRVVATDVLFPKGLV